MNMYWISRTTEARQDYIASQLNELFPQSNQELDEEIDINMVSANLVAFLES